MNTLNNENYRYELKFLLSTKYANILKYRLELIMDKDENYPFIEGRYYIRSLYFDDIYDTAYYEKVDGVEDRIKYRIRYYNFDPSYIVLELKGKKNNFTYKKQDKITREEYDKIINKDYDIDTERRPLLKEFITKSKSKNLIPSVIVDYSRIAFTYPVADVRITFDEDISSGIFNYDLFDENINLDHVIEPDEVVLEVKYNEILPKIIKEVLATVPMTRIAISKFAMCKEKKEV